MMLVPIEIPGFRTREMNDWVDYNNHSEMTEVIYPLMIDQVLIMPAHH